MIRSRVKSSLLGLMSLTFLACVDPVDKGGSPDAAAGGSGGRGGSGGSGGTSGTGGSGGMSGTGGTRTPDGGGRRDTGRMPDTRGPDRRPADGANRDAPPRDTAPPDTFIRRDTGNAAPSPGYNLPSDPSARTMIKCIKGGNCDPMPETMKEITRSANQTP